MTRLALKSTLPLALVLGVACAVPAGTVAQAQTSRDPPDQRNINDPANQRNLNDSNIRFQEQGRPLNDPASARGTTGAAAAPNPNQKGEKDNK